MTYSGEGDGLAGADEGRFGEEVESEVRTTKEALRNAQATIEAMKHDAEKKEIAWMLRINQLEQQLESVRHEQGSHVLPQV